MAELSLVVTGDSLISRRTANHPDAPYRELMRIIGEADVAFTNLEMVLNDGVGTPSDQFNMSADPAIAHDLKALGFDLVSVGNNHAMNYGAEGLLLSIDALRHAGLAVAGAGRDLDAARRPAYVETPTARVALVATTATFASGEQASHRERNRSGRAGINPIRSKTRYVVDDDSIAALRRIADMTGMTRANEVALTRFQAKLGTGEAPDAGAYTFLGSTFQAAATGFRTISTPDEGDVAEITRRVREARALSDIVVVSAHCHEAGAEEELPPDFLVTFAHSCIDAGADVFAGHGPHLMRGGEVYSGKPIFYSLSNFFYQFDYVETMPGENYLSPQMRDWTRAEYNARSRQRGHREWETIVPRLVFDGREIREIRLYPAELGFGQPLPRRGTPRLAQGEQAKGILDHFAKLSAHHGATIEIRGDEGRLRL